MATDIVERLRTFLPHHADSWTRMANERGEAATEIAALRQQLEETQERETLHRADAKCAWKEAEALRHELGLAREDLACFRSERSYVIGCNDGWDEAIEQAVKAMEDYAQRLVPDPANDRARYHVRYATDEVRSLAAHEGREG